MAGKKSKGQVRFIDLFAGCGGLSEGFIQAGYAPVAHVEIDQAACYTLRTRMAYHWLTCAQKSDDTVRLRLNKRNLAFNAVSHVVDGRAWYKRKSSEKWNIDAAWLKDRLATLAEAFTGDECVFIAYLNKDDHSTQRLYMKGMTSLPREDGGKNIALRDFLL